MKLCNAEPVSAIVTKPLSNKTLESLFLECLTPNSEHVSISHNKLTNDINKKTMYATKSNLCQSQIYCTHYSEDLPFKNTAPIVKMYLPNHSPILTFNTHFLHFIL